MTATAGTSTAARAQHVQRLDRGGFLASPALARGADGSVWLAYLEFTANTERVKVTRAAGEDLRWDSTVDVSPAGSVFPPAVAIAGNTAWTCWVARDQDTADMPPERAVFTLWGRAMQEHGMHSEPLRLAGAPGRRPYAPAMCTDGSGGLWLVYEVWDAGSVSDGVPRAGRSADIPVRLEVQRLRDGAWGAAGDVPVPTAWGTAGRVLRRYDPAIATGAGGAVHVVWWSPNDGEPWDTAGTRAGTTADALRAIGPTAGQARDGASTGSDIWYARFDGATWTTPARLNHTTGWHLHPRVAVDAGGRVWISWGMITPIEIYGQLNSDVPYVQTATARSRRAPWFREARPVVRVLNSSTGPWSVVGPARAAPPDEGLEPGIVADAGHTLFPQILCAGGTVALLTRRYGADQAARLNTGEGQGRIRAFDAALTWLSADGWGEPQVLHEPALGGILGNAAVLSLSDGKQSVALVAWQADLGTRNSRSDLCLARVVVPAGRVLGEQTTPLIALSRAAGVSSRSGELQDEHLTSVASDRQREADRRAWAGGDVAQKSHSSCHVRCVREGEGLPSTGMGVFFGNIHMHTEQSFCRRPTSMLLDFNYRWAQDCMRQDFAVLTDHAETKSAYEWWLNRKAAAFYTTPAFAALLGYEWTSRYNAETGQANGHVDVYFRGDPPHFWPANAPESDSLPGLWSMLARGEREGYPAFTVSHHPPVHNFRRTWSIWGGDTLEPVIEIHQDRRGSFERRGCVGGDVLPARQLLDGHFVSDALAQGHTLGFVSGGDHMGISMTATFTASLTRGAIFDAIRTRRCYAVTGAKILIDLAVEVNGRSGGMGQNVSLANATEARLRACVEAPSPIARLVLVRNSADVYVLQAGGTTAKMDAGLGAGPGDHVYLRVELTDGELAWTSPVFFHEG